MTIIGLNKATKSSEVAQRFINYPTVKKNRKDNWPGIIARSLNSLDNESTCSFVGTYIEVKYTFIYTKRTTINYERAIILLWENIMHIFINIEGLEISYHIQGIYQEMLTEV